MKKIIVLLITILILVTLFGCTDEKVTKQGETGDSKQNAQSEKEEKQTAEYEKTDKINIGNIVTSVTDARQFQGGGYNKPAAGKVFYLITLELSNEGYEPKDYNPFNYKIEDANAINKNMKAL